MKFIKEKNLFLKLTFNIVITILLLHISNCSNPVEPLQNVETELGENTRIPSKDGLLTNYIINDSSLTLSFAGNVPNYNTSNILIDSTGSGYCRKIKSIQIQGNTLFISTSKATFTDAFKNARIKYKTKPIGTNMPKKLITTLRNRDTTYFEKSQDNKRGNNKINIKFKEARLFIDDAPKGEFEIGFSWDIVDISLSITSPGGQLVGEISLDTLNINGKIGLEFELREQLWNMNYIRFVLYGSKTTSFKNINAGFNISSGDELKTHLSVVPRYLLGLIPMGILVFAIEAGTEFGIEVEISRPMIWSFDFSFNYSGQAGFEATFENGYPNPHGVLSAQGNPSFVYRGFTGQGGSSTSIVFKPYVEQDLYIKVYDFIGPKLIFRPCLPIEIALDNPITANVYAALELGAGIDIGLHFFKLDFPFEFTAIPLSIPILKNQPIINIGTLPAPNLISPTNGATGQSLTPILDWTDVNTATLYTVLISTNNSFSNNIDSASVTQSQYSIPTGKLSNNTTYYWKVKASNSNYTSDWSTVWNFTTIIQGGLAAPNLISPLNGSQNQSITPLLDWSDVSNALYYKVQISTNSSFSIITDSITLSQSQYNIPNGKLSNNTTYYWRVNASDGSQTSNWSSIWNFKTIAQGGLAAPVLLSPGNNSTGITLTPQLDWNDVTGATKYNIQVSTSTTFITNVVDVQNISESNYSIPSGKLNNNTKYFWHVKAKNSTDSSGWSDIWNFTTQNQISGWQVSTNVCGVTTTLRSVYFTDINNGYAVGDSGKVLKTTNAGLNWTLKTITPYNRFNTVYFTSQNVGYIAGQDILLKTINAGNNWDIIGAGIRDVNCMIFTDVNTGYVGTSYYLGGSILKTTDAGLSWKDMISIYNQNMISIFFSDQYNGYVGCTYNNLAKTTNAGLNWTSQGMIYTYTRGIYFVDNNSGWLALSGYTNGGIAATTNGGVNWSYQINPTTSGLNSVFFTDPQTGYIAGNSGVILKTTNGGWGGGWYQTPVLTTSWLYCVFFIDSNNGYTVGDNGTILKTTTGGEIKRWF